MIYEIIFTETAKIQLKKLELPIQKRIISVIERIRLRPESFVKKLVGMPYYRLRVGDYRVIIDIQRNRLIIMIMELGHRKHIYDKL